MPEEPKKTNPVKPADDGKAKPANPATVAGDQAKSGGNQVANAVGSAVNAVRDAKATTLPKGPSPIQKQHRDIRSQPEYAPIVIVFLSGPYKGQTLDVGFNVSETSQSQTAEWEDQKGETVRVGCNFKKLSTRTFQMTLAYFDTTFDISHMIENVMTLQQVSEEDRSMPKLFLKQGDLIAAPVVCTEIRPKYSEPHSGSTGFRHAEVEVGFKLLGGVASEHALGVPLTSTPLTDWYARTPKAVRDREAQLAVTDLTLAKCLSASSNRQLDELIKKDRTGNVDDVLKLQADAFIQGSVGGIFDSSIFEDERVKEKLHKDLALQVAKGVSGVGIESRRLANAIAANDDGTSRNLTQGLTIDMQKEVEGARADLKSIEKAIEAQDLTNDSEVFGDKQRTAGDRLRRLASCGLTLRQSGAAAVNDSLDNKPGWQKWLDKLMGGEAGASNDVGARNKAVLGKINETLNDKSLTDEDIKQQFGLKTESQVRALRNGVPYTSRSQFEQHSSRQKTGLTGVVTWNNFIDHNAQKDADSEKDKKPGETKET